MELFISISALIVSFAAVLVSVIIEYRGTVRARKQATLDAYNNLQTQVFDELNLYTYRDIQEICKIWDDVVLHKKGAEDIGKNEDEIDSAIEKFKILSGYLARIEHFALGVNEKIYDLKTAERAGTVYLVSLYRGKLKPILDCKQGGNAKAEYYAEFRMLVEHLERIENGGNSDKKNSD